MAATGNAVGRRKGAPKTGGRKKGTPNKSTADVKALAQNYTGQAIETLASIMGDESMPAAARVAAVKEILDRGHGKSSQALEVSGAGGGPVLGAMVSPAQLAEAVRSVRSTY